MREIFTYGSVGRAPGNWCFYPEIGIGLPRHFFVVVVSLNSKHNLAAVIGRPIMCNVMPLAGYAIKKW